MVGKTQGLIMSEVRCHRRFLMISFTFQKVTAECSVCNLGRKQEASSEADADEGWWLKNYVTLFYDFIANSIDSITLYLLNKRMNKKKSMNA